MTQEAELPQSYAAVDFLENDRGAHAALSSICEMASDGLKEKPPVLHATRKKIVFAQKLSFPYIMAAMSKLRYLKTSQIVPGKGMSFTLYEVEDTHTIVRMLTALPEVDEIAIYPKPPVKKLFAPERCEPVEADEFLRLWKEGEARRSS